MPGREWQEERFRSAGSIKGIDKVANHLFLPIRLRSLKLENRIMVAPMCQYSAQDGVPNDWHLVHLGSLALGGFGLVMVEATAVSPVGRITHNCLGLYTDAQEEGFARILSFCREHGTAAMAIQLGHAGRKASTQTPANGGAPLGPSEHPWETLAPSALAYDTGWHTPRAIDGPGLMRIKSEMVESAIRANRLGFELIELHMAHGYLMHQFLSPLSNHRTDAYGGDLQGRMRFPLECFAAVRAALPESRPLGVRISATDWIEGGWDIEQTVVLARELERLGCDFIDVSSAGVDPRQKIKLEPGYQVPFAERVKRETGMTVIAVGLITGAHQAEAILADGRADMVALARGAMDDPHWGWHAAMALNEEIRYPEIYARAAPKAWPGAKAMRQA